jgi:hypothetical protein
MKNADTWEPREAGGFGTAEGADPGSNPSTATDRLCDCEEVSSALWASAPGWEKGGEETPAVHVL